MQTTTQTFTQPQNNNRLFIRNFPPTWNKNNFITLFQIGTVTKVDIKRKPNQPPFAFVTFTSHITASMALQSFNKKKINGYTLKIEYARPKESTPKELVPISQEERIIEYIPIRKYFFNENHQFTINGIQVEIPLNTSYRPGSIVIFPGVGKERNGKRGDVIVELKCEQNNMFECQGDTLIQHLIYSRDYLGYSGDLQIQLIDGQIVSLPMTLVEGYEKIIPGFGFIKEDGTRGDCHIIIHIQ